MSGLAEILAENQRLREALAANLASHKQELATKDAQLQALRQTAETLAQQLELIRLSVRGAASQRFVSPQQAALPFVASEVTPPPREPTLEEEPKPASPETNKRRPRRRSREDVDHFPAKTVRCTADPDARCVGCGEPLAVIGQATSFRVEWVPGHFIVEDVARDKCACPHCPDQGVLTVSGPYALPRALCGNSLLAHVLVDKYADHLPLNRQAKRITRQGLRITSNTLASWVCAGAGLLKVVANAVRARLLTEEVLQGDDTGFPVQDGGNGTLRKGRLWAFTDQEEVFYAFSPTKEGIYPAEILDGFEGKHLLVDGGSEFNQVVQQLDLNRAGCWAHLRTYFHKALTHHPAEATMALGTIRDLFLLERKLWGKPPDEVLTGRLERSKPLIDGFFEWTHAMALITRPESTLGKALTYANNQQKAMSVHLAYGELPMHNNLSELMLRQAVVGRKNWLFARTTGGAAAAATMYTLIGSCMLQGIDPHAYLVGVLHRLPDWPSHRVGELTPRQWRLGRQGHIAAGV